MRLAVSNIAWAAEEAATAYALLKACGVRGLEIAPGLFLAGGSEAEAMARAEGLTLCSMQSLLFGVEGAALFGSEAERAVLEDAMARAAALAGRLGVSVMVFGSPRNRTLPDGMGADAAREIWVPAFRRMGAVAEAAGTRIALEPNPARYGTNFMTTLAETLAVARAVAHPGVAVNLDLGALIVSGELGALDLAAVLPDVAHVHLSAPDLAPLGGVGGEVRRFLADLGAAGWDGWVSIEMRGGLGALAPAIDLVQEAMR